MREISGVLGANSKMDAGSYFYRVENDSTQTKETAILQVKSGEIWGTEGRVNFTPTVKAYPGNIPSSRRGIQFTTDIAPHDQSAPNWVNWYYPDTPGVQHRHKDGKDYACITAVVENFQP